MQDQATQACMRGRFEFQQGMSFNGVKGLQMGRHRASFAIGHGTAQPPVTQKRMDGRMIKGGQHAIVFPEYHRAIAACGIIEWIWVLDKVGRVRRLIQHAQDVSGQIAIGKSGQGLHDRATLLE